MVSCSSGVGVMDSYGSSGVDGLSMEKEVTFYVDLLSEIIRLPALVQAWSGWSRSKGQNRDAKPKWTDISMPKTVHKGRNVASHSAREPFLTREPTSAVGVAWYPLTGSEKWSRFSPG
jgi:hypothetical protein